MQWELGMERSQTETLGCLVVLELVGVGFCVATNDPSTQTPGLLLDGGCGWGGARCYKRACGIWGRVEQGFACQAARSHVKSVGGVCGMGEHH